ncbi:Hypothetical protein HDN1F_19830 [gamma proteobacterium HdN1]|nr:Hypothetical protein HDN1F_19830 [gamma proteobacterium HdN1]
MRFKQQFHSFKMTAVFLLLVFGPPTLFNCIGNPQHSLSFVLNAMSQIANPSSAYADPVEVPRVVEIEFLRDTQE